MLTLSLPYPGRTARLRYFERVRHAPWAICLDSGGGDGPKARYDIFSAWPHTTLTTRGPVTEISDPDGTRDSADCPFELVKQALGETAASGDYPFCGGALGYFGYDLGRRLERLPVLAEADCALPDMALGLYDWAVVIDHQQQCATLIKQARHASPSWEALVALFTTPPEPSADASFQLTSAWRSNMNRAGYGAAFRAVQDYLRAGDCYQVNLAQRFSARYQGDPYAAWLTLNAANRAPFSGYLRLSEHQQLLSVSPERFLEVHDGRVSTDPIKGTRPRSVDPDEDARLAEELRTSPKDRAENLMIVDLLRNDLGKHCAIGSVRVPELFGLYSFPAVHHLISTVTGQLAEGKSAVDLLRGAFPGGSITGAPKVRAMEIIEALEPQRRGVYCGSVAYLSYCGRMDSNIAIRTLVCDAGQIHAHAGGGLVADSVEEAEYQETFHKLGRILPVLTAMS